jgi:ABC-type branched-subunit amino acid transport system substrate-binding protein
MRGKRVLLALLLGALCAGALAACGSSSSTTTTSSAPAASSTAATTSAATSSAATSSSAPANTSPINVALITFKLPALDFITDYQAGANAALAYINSIGGWGGRKANLIVCNSMLAPGPTATCAHSTLAQQPVAEFGCETSWSAAGLLLYAAAGVPSFNCTNTQVDYTHPMSFGLGTGAPGEAGGMAKWICATQPSVKTLAYLSPADPEQEADIPKTLGPIFKGCGKTVSYTWIPFTAIDMTPLVTKALSTHPQWVMTTIGQAQMVNVAKALQQQGFPSDHLSMSSNALDQKGVIAPAGSALNGTYASDEWTGWGLDVPDANTYREWATKSGAPNPLSGNTAQGWMYMMWIYTGAKAIGFANFDAHTLTHWLNASANGMHILMSRTYINPGPSKTPSVHQPYVQILRLQDGKMTLVTQGTNAGWILPLS